MINALYMLPAQTHVHLQQKSIIQLQLTFSEGYQNNVLTIYYQALIDSCNFINNSIKPGYGIIFHNGGNYKRTITITNCSFINNSVSENSYLIYNDGNLAIIDNCYIDNSTEKTFFHDTDKNNPRTLFTNDLTLFSTDICQAEFETINKNVHIKSVNKTDSINDISHKFLRRR